MKRYAIISACVALLVGSIGLACIAQASYEFTIPPQYLDLSLEQMRGQFQQLLLLSPNYFGNLKDSQFQIVYPMVTETYYEELTCVGYNLEAELLEATVQIKRSSGYWGTLCSAGSDEYVRFYVDYGSGWEDVGMVAFDVHDIPTANDCANAYEKPLSYVATISLDPSHKACLTAFLPKVRAILSWNMEPPANSPNWLPVWGSVLDGTFQIKPGLFFVGTLINVLMPELKIPEGVLESILPAKSLEEILLTPIPIPEPAPLQLTELVELYHGGEIVEPERFTFEALQLQLDAGVSDFELYSSTVITLQEIGIAWTDALDWTLKPASNTSYEELKCLGLDYNREWLTATIHVKKPYGYSGGLCTAGSKEYVSFWVDWDDSCTWTYVDTVEISVHDIPSIPSDGLWYTAVLPVDLNAYRQNCSLPKIARIRAVLSWSSPPSTTDPNAIPYWGNRRDAHVLIPPGDPIDYSDPDPIIGILGGIPVSTIHDTTGLTTSDAEFALTGIKPDSAGRPCPFGGRVVVQGPTYPGWKYMVSVREIDASGNPLGLWTAVTKQMKIWDWTGTTYTTQVTDSDGYFTYLPHEQNVNCILAWWDTTGDGLWEVKIEIKGSGKPPDVHRIQLDNTSPDVAVEIASGGNCKDFTQGFNMTGSFKATDAYFGNYVLHTSPYSAPSGALIPTSGTSSMSSGTWSLDTSGMTPCGYVLYVWAQDRAIINSSYVGHERSRSVGFCVREP